MSFAAKPQESTKEPLCDPTPPTPVVTSEGRVLDLLLPEFPSHDQVRLSVRMNHIFVELHEESLLFTLALEGIGVKLKASEGFLELQGSISSLMGKAGGDNPWESNEQWSKIISTLDEAELQFEVAFYPKTLQPREASLASVTARMSKLRIVATQPLMKVISFASTLLSSFDFEEKPETTAGTVPPLVKLNIVVDSPVILLPLSPDSSDCIGVDFGEIAIINDFHQTSDPRLVMSRLVIAIQRVELPVKIDEGPNAKIASLQDLSFVLSLPHALTVDSHSKQAVVGSFSLPVVRVGIEAEQLKLVLKILSCNLAHASRAGFSTPKQAKPGGKKNVDPMSLNFSISEIEVEVRYSPYSRLVVRADDVLSSVKMDSKGDTSVSALLQSFSVSDYSNTTSAVLLEAQRASSTSTACLDLSLEASDAGLACNTSLGHLKVNADLAVICRLVDSLSDFTHLLPAAENESAGSVLPPRHGSETIGTDIEEPIMSTPPALRFSLRSQQVDILFLETGVPFFSSNFGSISFAMSTWENETVWIDVCLKTLVCRIEDGSEWQHSTKWAHFVSIPNASQDRDVIDFKFRSYPRFDVSGAPLNVIEACMDAITLCVVCKPILSLLDSVTKLLSKVEELSLSLTRGTPKPTVIEDLPPGFLKLNVSTGLHIVIPESPESPSNVTARFARITATNSFSEQTKGVMNNIKVGVWDLAVTAAYKATQSVEYSYQTLLNLNEVNANLSMRSGRRDSDLNLPDIGGSMQLESILFSVPTDAFSTILRIYTTNLSLLIQKAEQLSSLPKSSTSPSPASDKEMTASFDFSVGEIFLGIIQKEGSLGCGLRGLTCRMSSTGTSVSLNAGISCIFSQYNSTVGLPDAPGLEWPPPDPSTRSSPKKIGFSLSLHTCNLELSSTPQDLTLNAALSNVTLTYSEESSTATILTLTDEGSTGSRITARVSAKPLQNQADCDIDFTNLGFLFTVDRPVLGKLSMIGLEFLAFTKKIADNLITLSAFASDQSQSASSVRTTSLLSEFRSSQAWDIREPGNHIFSFLT